MFGMVTTLGVGLIGTGHMGKAHALAWNAVRPVFGTGPQPRLVHVAEVNEELAQRRADELGFERATGDWRALVTDPEVEVISIATPNALHAEMAIAALAEGKHVWCEKPMSVAYEDAERMAAAAKVSGKVAALGYNYIQSPALRHVRRLLGENAIGTVNHIRFEMDEDFLADPDAPFHWTSDENSGYGALDDFGVHPLSLVQYLFGGVARVIANLVRPYADRPASGGGRRGVQTYDVASVLFELDQGASGVMALNRAAWGRKGRLSIQIFGSRGTIAYDQERMNEFQLYLAEDNGAEQGFRTVLTGPAHAPYGQFVPLPGHGIGFNDLKVIECHEVLRAIEGEDAQIIDFVAGLDIERTVHAMARSHREKRWVEV